MTDKLKEYEIVKRTEDSEIISSFYLKSTSGDMPEFLPGQYLTFSVPVDSSNSAIKREYSLSWWDSNTARVTIKRESGMDNTGKLHQGVVSNWFHDNVKVGDVVKAFAPRGDFILDNMSKRPVVLLSGGVGLTPVLAMAHSLVKEGKRNTWFIHACENGKVHAMAGEVKQLKYKSNKFRSHVCYRDPCEEDALGVNYDSEGVVTAELLKNLLPLDDYEFYLCGPSGFMQSVYDILNVLGVDEKRIKYEFFGPARLLNSRNIVSQNTTNSTSGAEIEKEKVVRFVNSGIDSIWNPDFENLLEFAEEQGLTPNYSCRMGSCDSCKTKIISGDIEYTAAPVEEPEKGSVLLCCSRPISDISLDL